MLTTRRFTHSLILLGAFFATLAEPVSGDDDKAELALLPINTSEASDAKITNVTFSATAIGEELYKVLAGGLAETGKIELADKGMVIKQVTQNGVSESDYANTAAMNDLASALGVRYLLTGKIKRIHFHREVSAAPENVLEVNVTQTGKIIYIINVFDAQSDKFPIENERVTAILDLSEIPARQRINLTVQEFKNILLDTLALDVIERSLKAIFPLKVVSLEDSGLVVLNQGQDFDLSVGDRFAVFNEGKTFRDPDTGRYLGTERKYAGTIQVIGVHSQYSTARARTKQTPSVPIKRGSVCVPLPPPEIKN